MMSKHEWFFLISIFILIIGLGYGGYRYNVLTKDLFQSRETTKNLETKLANSEFEKSKLAENLQLEQDRNFLFEEQISEMSGQVGTLTKLSQVDKELLKKYSKIYFLNENYVPAQLTNIKSQYTKISNEESSQTLQINAKVWPFLVRLFRDSANNKTPLLAVSAYRSFSEQSDLKLNYKMAYGVDGANLFSADQGYSEHQLGTTVDFATASSSTATFEQTEANKWLIENGYKYGFVLSYPKQNKYYMYEPWHWRFVGVELATKLHDDDKYFYDIDQREIDKYLISLFD